nr:hypothetical protein [Pseudenhygromyxa sp. WMMC2535]
MREDKPPRYSLRVVTDTITSTSFVALTAGAASSVSSMPVIAPPTNTTSSVRAPRDLAT